MQQQAQVRQPIRRLVIVGVWGRYTGEGTKAAGLAEVEKAYVDFVFALAEAE